MIVKNEEATIERCIESVCPFIDYYIICDTGSSDNTKALIKAFFDKKGISGEILDHKWEDFGTNRTKALEACYGKTKWALMIDADDTIEGKLPIEKFDDNVDGYNVQLSRGNFIWSRVQIFNVKNKPWKFLEPLHEYAWADNARTEDLVGDYRWTARSEGSRAKAFKDEVEKYTNDYFILKGYLKKNPNDPRKQFYAAQSAFDARMYKIAEAEYLAKLKLENWIEEAFYSWYKIGQCREKLGKPLPQIIDAYMQAYDTAPYRVEPLYSMSCLYRFAGRPRSAFLVANLGNKIPLPKNSLFVESDQYLWGIHDEIGTCAYYAGQPELGFTACKKLLSEPYLPENHRARVKNNYNAYLKDFPDLEKIA